VGYCPPSLADTTLLFNHISKDMKRNILLYIRELTSSVAHLLLSTLFSGLFGRLKPSERLLFRSQLRNKPKRGRNGVFFETNKSFSAYLLPKRCFKTLNDVHGHERLLLTPIRITYAKHKEGLKYVTT
jgi:GGDEF domain-containing protein